MKQITEDYCSFEISKLLKEKGFNCECQGYYEIPTEISSHKDVRKQLITLPKNWNEYGKECVVCEYVSIPTHQMALKWLREVHNTHIDILTYTTGKNIQFRWVGYEKGRLFSQEEGKTIYFDSYEQAVEAALKYVLENLI